MFPPFLTFFHQIQNHYWGTISDLEKKFLSFRFYVKSFIISYHQIIEMPAWCLTNRIRNLKVNLRFGDHFVSSLAPMSGYRASNLNKARNSSFSEARNARIAKNLLGFDFVCYISFFVSSTFQKSSSWKKLREINYCL